MTNPTLYSSTVQPVTLSFSPSKRYVFYIMYFKIYLCSSLVRMYYMKTMGRNLFLKNTIQLRLFSNFTTTTSTTAIVYVNIVIRQCFQRVLQIKRGRSGLFLIEFTVLSILPYLAVGRNYNISSFRNHFKVRVRELSDPK